MLVTYYFALTDYSHIGILQLHPGAINSIPSKSNLEIGRNLFLLIQVFFSFGKRVYFFQPIIHNILFADVRDIDEKRRNEVIEKVHRSAIDISKLREVELTEFKIINQDPPALSDKSVINAMEFAAKQLGLQYKLMISKAYHDLLFHG